MQIGKDLENSNDYTSKIYENIGKLSNEILILKKKYTKFFGISNIFSNENGGKTRLNRQLYSENHEDVQASILEINLYVEESLGILREEFKILLSKNNQSENSYLLDFLFDDKNFLELANFDSGKLVLSHDTKSKYILDIKRIIKYKNKLTNLKYFIDMVDTSIFDKNLNKLTVEDLINSSLIFEIIDSYALQYEELKKFEIEVQTFRNRSEEILSINRMESLLELYKRRVDGYFYADVRYKIVLDYEIIIDSSKLKKINMSYVENIISRLIEQSSMDVIKKELKKGKIQKQIEVSIIYNKGILKIEVRNNGYEVRNIHSLFVSDLDNKYILEAKNFVNTLNGTLEIGLGGNGEGMQYTIAIKLV